MSTQAIHITEPASRFLLALIKQQDEPDMALKLIVHKPGTPSAECELTFAFSDQRHADDPVLEQDGLTLILDQASVPWLDQATIDFIEDPAGGALQVTAPNIKGHTPAADAPLADRVNWILESEINPSLAAHGGQVALKEIINDSELVLQFGGGCQGCSMVSQTLKHGVEKTLKTHCPEIEMIHDATDHESGQTPYFQ